MSVPDQEGSMKWNELTDRHEKPETAHTDPQHWRNSTRIKQRGDTKQGPVSTECNHEIDMSRQEFHLVCRTGG